MEEKFDLIIEKNHAKSKSAYDKVFSVDNDIICCSKNNTCFIEINKGYKCKKHRIGEIKTRINLFTGTSYNI